MITWNDMEDMYRLVFGPVGLAGTSPSDNSTWFTYDVEVKPHSCQTNKVNMPAVKSVIFNKNATIVYFDDGTKCIVRKSAMDEYNREHAVVYAIVKRAYGKVDPKTGIVEGNGMGNMLAKIVANGIDQVKQEEEKKAKKPASKNGKQNDEEDNDLKDVLIHCEDCDDTSCPNNPDYEDKPVRLRLRDQAKKPYRDSKGRFAVKANRKR